MAIDILFELDPGYVLGQPFTIDRYENPTAYGQKPTANRVDERRGLARVAAAPKARLRVLVVFVVRGGGWSASVSRGHPPASFEG